MIKSHLFLFFTLLSGFACASESDSTAVIKLLKADYRTRQTDNVKAHLANCTKDYVLIEDGKVWDMAKEIARYQAMAGTVHTRKDIFTIQMVNISGDMAYTVYDLRSEINENKNISTLHWTESAIFRKVDGAWKIALIQSTTFPSAKTDVAFDHVALLVRDLAKSTAFYHSLLKYDTIPVPAHGNSKVTWFSMNNKLQLHLVEGLKDTIKLQFNHIAFSVASVNEFIERLNAAHIKYRGIELRADNVHQIYFNDPDGYEIEVNDRKQ